MKSDRLRPMMVVAACLATATPVVAGAFSATSLGTDVQPSATRFEKAAFGDGPATGPRHARPSHGNRTPKDTGPSHADMHGATRESADKAYRKQYGF